MDGFGVVGPAVNVFRDVHRGQNMSFEVFDTLQGVHVVAGRLGRIVCILVEQGASSGAGAGAGAEGRWRQCREGNKGAGSQSFQLRVGPFLPDVIVRSVVRHDELANIVGWVL